METADKSSAISEDAPIFKSWKAIYWVVIGFLVFCILIFYLITGFFSVD